MTGPGVTTAADAGARPAATTVTAASRTGPSMLARPYSTTSAAGTRNGPQSNAGR
jgi:hypothetical protein